MREFDAGPRLAEVVETTGEMDHLCNEKVDEAQGFLLSRPLYPDALDAQILGPSRSSKVPHTP